MNIERKRLKEQKIISLMIKIYCKRHDDIDEKELLDYTIYRINQCPVMADKTFCSQCKIHCYNIEKQKEIKKVMRYSSPRMIFYYPILTIRHALNIKEKL